MHIPANYKLLYDSGTISAAIKKLAQDINTWATLEHSRSGKQVIIIAPMRGAVFFAADLTRALDHSVEIRTVVASSYSKNQQASPLTVERWNFSIDDRFVIVIDEICDSGRTLSELTTLANSSGAFLVKSAALVLREHAALSFKPDLVGLSFKGTEWLVGYGMDDNDTFRNLSGIYTIS